MKFILVGLGGAAGSLTRYYIGNLVKKIDSSRLHWGTFLINISGAFLLGWVTFLMKMPQSHKYMYYIVSEGFLASYTTFSTFMYEGFIFIKGRKNINAVIYVVLSIFFGVLFFLAGYHITGFFNIK